MISAKNMKLAGSEAQIEKHSERKGDSWRLTFGLREIETKLYFREKREESTGTSWYEIKRYLV